MADLQRQDPKEVLGDLDDPAEVANANPTVRNPDATTEGTKRVRLPLPHTLQDRLGDGAIELAKLACRPFAPEVR
jgi:hypothetical protein